MEIHWRLTDMGYSNPDRLEELMTRKHINPDALTDTELELLSINAEGITHV
jgi:hypothetical protein